MTEFTVTFQHVEPDILPIDFEGEHLLLRGPLAWFYKLFQSMDCEEKAVRELYPWLMEAKRNKVKAAAIPTAAASNPERGKSIV